MSRFDLWVRLQMLTGRSSIRFPLRGQADTVRPPFSDVFIHFSLTHPSIGRHIQRVLLLGPQLRLRVAR